MIEQTLENLTAKIARNNELLEAINQKLSGINPTPIPVPVFENSLKNNELQKQAFDGVPSLESSSEPEITSGLNEAEVPAKVVEPVVEQKTPTEDDLAEAQKRKVAICNKVNKALGDALAVKKLINDFGYASVKEVPYERTDEFIDFMRQNLPVSEA